MSDPETEAFYARHEAAGGVVVVIAQQSDGQARIGVFRTLQSAHAWVETLSEDEYAGCVFSPYILDDPDFGNIERDKMQ